MAVKEYSKAKDGNSQIGQFFKVKEFACKDGSDKIFIDTTTVGYLDKIREHFNKPISITSAYRSPAYNAKIGGAKNSYHIKGQATDITVTGVSPKEVAKFAESIKVPGIGCYDYGGGAGFTHVDSRSTKYFWRQTSKNGASVAVSTHGGSPAPAAANSASVAASAGKPTLRNGAKSADVKTLQTALNRAGTSPALTADGDFGAKTEAAVKNFQKKNGLTADGIVGAKTWAKLGV